MRMVFALCDELGTEVGTARRLRLREHALGPARRILTAVVGPDELFSHGFYPAVPQRPARFYLTRSKRAAEPDGCAANIR